MRHPFPMLAAPALAIVASLAATLPAAAQTPSAYDQAARAYELLAQGRAEDAAAAAQGAVAADPANLDYRLLLADSLLAADKPAEAFEALQPVAGLADYRVQTRLAQAAGKAGRKAEAAEAYGRAAPLADTAESRAYLTRARLMTLVELGRIDEARAEFDRAWADGVLRGQAPLDTAMLAIAVGDDVTAQLLFAEADQDAPIAGRVALDAGYSARRLGRDQQALIWFRRGLDSLEAGQMSLEPQREHEIRREVETLERRWGVIATVSRGGATVDGATTSGAPMVTQAGVEAYWRVSGDNGGRPVDLFVRAYGVVDADGGWASGGDTVQGWVGVRWRPLAETNLVLEASRMVAVGDLARDDTMLRASWSAEAGGDLRFDRQSWPSWRLYGDLAYIVEDQQTLGLADARAGWTWRIGPSDLVTPYLGARLYYDSWQADESALVAGPGVSWRRWFRESRYGAPASYVDFWLGYDFSLSGDGRGEGLVVGATVRY